MPGGSGTQAEGEVAVWWLVTEDGVGTEGWKSCLLWPSVVGKQRAAVRLCCHMVACQGDRSG